ncbi:MAG: hypothetical protein E7C71_01470 [Veillonella sp.]|uniref:hypothetical protein n=1 Tax=Veillonella sp. TaxID=1926307 RepID=UPI002666453A|nr:hypothetical protein [Veillonella sp.]MDU2594972.1 hypothetical protein [Veillonella sp.]
MVACKLSIKKIFDCIERDDKFKEFKTTYGLTPSDEMGGTKFAANFYKSAVVNYKGKVTGSKDLYSEVIAETLINDNFIKDWLNLIPVRPEHFKINHPNTDENVDALKITNRKEEILAKLLFYQHEVAGLGYIFDYQTPLKETRNDSYGKIDLLGYNTDDKCYSVIELKYRPSGSEETLLRCVLEAYTYYRLLDIKQINSAKEHEGIQQLKKLHGYKHTHETELVVLFDERSCAKEDGGAETNLMLRIDPDKPNTPSYPSKTVVSQQFKECKELIDSHKRNGLQTLCEEILAQEPHLKQIRFVVLRVDTDSKSSYPTNINGWSRKLDRLYQAETLLTIPSKG